ncbi:amino acid adenylation domain-containing protein [Streptomyces sp. NPDC085596]|uniref:amino acid adenylation domain-containing protein n=1 Tax=Streptomyces sp. NPDC085596 TaxID=3365731 RepID=UPI0037D6451F
MIAERFRDRAARTPGALAVSDGTTTLTYAELATSAAEFARGLAQLGVRRGDLVGLLGGRSVAGVTALVGTVLAGAAYLPLNPGWPAARLRQITDHARPRLVVGLPDAGAGAVPAAEVRAAGRTAAAPQKAEETGDTGETPPAYVMFTSGSTGAPKGVVVGQRGVLRLVCAPEHPWLPAGTRAAHGAAPEFDAATLEVWGTLLNGGSLHIADAETMARPAAYAEFLRRERIGFAWLTAPLFHRMADHDPAMFTGLRTLMTGGDVVFAGHAARVLAHCPGLALYNGYGPTENTVFTTVHRITAPVPDPVPVGRAVAGTELYVCDQAGQPVPDGTEGELWVGGAGVARGYLGDPELTAARFPGGRYRTGDLVTRDPDGLVRFHGRADQQVKILGNLVEPAEVTTALLALPAVRQAHTVAVRDEAGEARLCAYAVTDGTGSGALRAALAGTLPRYLLPAHLTVLDRLPLKASGKVDTARLPAPRTHDGTPAPDELTALWSQVLGQDPAAIGPDSDFFALGGDSVRLGVLLDRIEARLGRRLGFRQVHEAPTPAGMRALLEHAGEATAPVPRGTGRTGPAHPAQRGLYALWQAGPDSVAYNIPVRLDLGAPVDPARLQAALDTLVDRHEALRTRLTADGDGIRQEVVDGVGFRLELDSSEGEFVRPFDLAAPPLLRARLTGDRRLLLDLHHIVADGVSVRVLVRELLGLLAGRTPAPVPLRWLDAARWCAGRDDDLGHWLTALAGAPGGGTLPTDRPRPPRPTDAGGRVRRDPVAADAVEKTARVHGTTPFVVLLAAYATALARIGGLTDLVIGTPVHGRAHHELADVVGMFVQTVPMRVRLDEDTTLGALVAGLRESHQDALDRGAVPYDRLVRELGAGRPGLRDPLIDAFLGLQNLDSYEFAEAGLTASLDFLHPGTTRFDLNLQVHVRPDRLVCDLEHSTELYERASADHLLDSVLLALDEIATAPEAPVLRRRAARTWASDADFDFGAAR